MSVRDQAAEVIRLWMANGYEHLDPDAMADDLHEKGLLRDRPEHSGRPPHPNTMAGGRGGRVRPTE